MKLFLISSIIAALFVSVAAALGGNQQQEDLPATARGSSVRQSRRLRRDLQYYSGGGGGSGYGGGNNDGSFNFFLSYTFPISDTVFSSFTDPNALNIEDPVAATFINTILGQATPYTPEVSASQPVNVNVLGAPEFREVLIVVARLVSTETAVQGCFDQLVLNDGSKNLVGALCYQGFTNFQPFGNGLFVITGGSGDFTGATGTILQNIDQDDGDATFTFSLYFNLKLA